MKSTKKSRSFYSVLLIFLILNSEGIGIVKSIELKKSFLLGTDFKFSSEKINSPKKNPKNKIPDIKHSQQQANELSAPPMDLNMKGLSSTSYHSDAPSQIVHTLKKPKNVMKRISKAQGSQNDSAINLKRNERLLASFNSTNISQINENHTPTGSKPTNRLSESKTRIFIILVFALTLVFQIINTVLENLIKHYETLKQQVQEESLKNFETVQRMWRNMQESHCNFFKFIRFDNKLNGVVTKMQMRILRTNALDLCNQKKNCDEDKFLKRMSEILKHIDQTQLKLDKFLDNKVSNACTLSGDTLSDTFYNLAERERKKLLSDLKIDIEKNNEATGKALEEIVEAANSTTTEKLRDGVENTKTVLDVVSSFENLFNSGYEYNTMQNYLTGPEKQDIINEVQKSQTQPQAQTPDLKLTNTPRAKRLIDGFTNFRKGSGTAVNYLSMAHSVVKSTNDQSTIQTLRTVFATIKAAVNVILYLPFFANNQDELNDINDSINEIIEAILDLAEGELTGEEVTEKVIQGIVNPSIKIGLTLALLISKKIILQKVMAVVDLIIAVGNTINNMIKLFSAMREYHEAKEQSFNHGQMLNRFTSTINNHLEYEKCEAFSEIARDQMALDKNRIILKKLFKDNLGINSIDVNSPAIKAEMSNIIDVVCIQDVNMCILLFNQKTLEFYKDSNNLMAFRRNLYYRITRSAISSISVAKSEQDELLLLTIGYKQYISFKNSDSYFSIMVCRGCSDIHAVTDIEYVDAGAEGIRSKIGQRPNSNNTMKAFSLGFVRNTHRYLVVTESTLEQGQEYLLDFELSTNETPSRFVRDRVMTKLISKTLSDYAFSNKKNAEGMIYGLILRSRGDSSCQKREGKVVFLSQKDDITLYLATKDYKRNALGGGISCDGAEEILFSDSNELSQMKQIYDFVLPTFTTNEKLKQLTYIEVNGLFKKNLYEGSYSEQKIINISSNSFDPLFVKGYPLFDIIDRELCRNEKCIFQDSLNYKSYRASIFSDRIDIFFKESKQSLFSNLLKYSSLSFLTMNKFNSEGVMDLKKLLKWDMSFLTVYEIFNHLKFNSGSSLKNEAWDTLWYDYWEMVIPITFEDTCPEGNEPTIFFNPSFGPQEDCLKNRPLRAEVNFPIEKNYLIYFSHTNPNHAKFNDLYERGWILHPDLFLTLDYLSYSYYTYYFHLEVYVMPPMESGFIPLGKNIKEKDPECSGSVLMKIYDFQNLYPKKRHLNQNDYYIYDFLFVFFHPINHRKPPTQSAWNSWFSPSNQLFSTQMFDISDEKFHKCKNNNKPFIFPISLEGENAYIEFEEKDGHVFLNQIKSSESTNRIKNVFYFEMRFHNPSDSDLNIDFNNEEIKTLMNYDYRPFLIPSNIVHTDVKDGFFIKRSRDSSFRVALRIWVKDDYKLKYKKPEICPHLYYW